MFPPREGEPPRGGNGPQAAQAGGSASTRHGAPSGTTNVAYSVAGALLSLLSCPSLLPVSTNTEPGPHAREPARSVEEALTARGGGLLSIRRGRIEERLGPAEAMLAA